MAVLQNTTTQLKHNKSNESNIAVVKGRYNIKEERETFILKLIVSLNIILPNCPATLIY